MGDISNEKPIADIGITGGLGDQHGKGAERRGKKRVRASAMPDRRVDWVGNEEQGPPEGGLQMVDVRGQAANRRSSQDRRRERPEIGRRKSGDSRQADQGMLAPHHWRRPSQAGGDGNTAAAACATFGSGANHCRRSPSKRIPSSFAFSFCSNGTLK